VRVALAMALLLLAAACDHSDNYRQNRILERRMSIDAYNCEFDATHRRNADGGYDAVQVEEEQLKLLIRQCMEAKGYDLSGKPDPEKDQGYWWWPF
jgi:hypothetical protein